MNDVRLIGEVFDQDVAVSSRFGYEDYSYPAPGLWYVSQGYTSSSQGA